MYTAMQSRNMFTFTNKQLVHFGLGRVVYMTHIGNFSYLASVLPSKP